MGLIIATITTPFSAPNDQLGACTSQGCAQDEAAQGAEEAAGLGRGPRLGTVSHGNNDRNYYPLVI